MNIGRIAWAHFCAMLLGSLALMMGSNALISGVSGLLDGLTKWLGGLLIFGVLSAVSIPFGLTMRWVVGKLPIQPLAGAMLGGLGLSLALMFVIHPETYISLSFETRLAGLLVVNTIAGTLAGWAFYRIEFSAKETSIVG